MNSSSIIRSARVVLTSSSRFPVARSTSCSSTLPLATVRSRPWWGSFAFLSMNVRVSSRDKRQIRTLELSDCLDGRGLSSITISSSWWLSYNVEWLWLKLYVVLLALLLLYLVHDATGLAAGEKNDTGACIGGRFTALCLRLMVLLTGSTKVS